MSNTIAFDNYEIVSTIIENESYSAYVCSNTQNHSKDLFAINVYKDKKNNGIISNYFKELKDNKFNDLKECFYIEDMFCVVFNYYKNTPLKQHLIQNKISPIQRREYIKSIIELVVEYADIMSLTLIEKLIRYDNIYYDENNDTLGFNYIFDFSDGFIFSAFPDICSKLGFVVQDVFYGCVINSKKFNQYIKFLKKRKYLNAKELLKDTKKALVALDSKKAFDVVRSQRIALFLKYNEVLDGYIPIEKLNKKKKSRWIFTITIVLIIASLLLYVFIMPDKNIFSIKNQTILDWINNTYDKVYEWLSNLK